MAILRVIDMQNNKKVSVAVGSAILVTVVAAAGYCLARKLEDWNKSKNDLEAIPWDVPEEYKSWKTFFRDPKQDTQDKLEVSN